MTSHSAVYFNRAARILRNEGKVVTIQVFQKKKDTVLCGMTEVTEMLKRNVIGPGFVLRALSDGDIVQPWEPVLEMTGDLSTFIEYESIYLGILARGSRVATNTRRVVEAANGKPVYFFGDRFDRLENQQADGTAVFVGGASAVCTDQMASGADHHIAAVGTMPHALIAAYGGDVVEACRAFRRTFPEIPLHALVDFGNDCVTDSVRCLHEFGDKLAGVRLDTSENMIDASLSSAYTYASMPWMDAEIGDFKPTGVNAQLVRTVRSCLNEAGGEHVKITVSGGFNVEKIKAFEEQEVPVDIYAVGSSILSGDHIDFTADVVAPIAKAGRRVRDSSRLKMVVNRGV